MQTQSEQINELAKALSLAQGELRNVAKNATNPHFKNHYADLAAIIDAISDPLHKNGLAITQTVTTELVTITNTIEQFLVTMLMHTSGQWIKSYYHLNPVKRDPQGYGGAITYGRRQCLAAIVNVAQTDDDGQAASHPPYQPPTKTEYKQQNQQNLVSAKAAAPKPDTYSSTNDQKKALVAAVASLVSPGNAFEKLSGADKDSHFLLELDKKLKGCPLADMAQEIYGALQEKMEMVK